MSELQEQPIFDSHFHIIENGYPLESNNGYIPDKFTIENYCSRMASYKLNGGVIVSGSFQGFDQTYLIDALDKLGSSFAGVTQLPTTASDKEIYDLNEHGVRAVRFNLNRGGSAGLEDLVPMANRIYDLVGWHVELYLGPNSLHDLKDVIPSLPKVCIDHLGMSKSNFEPLLGLIRKGLAIKATGFGRVDINVENAIREIHSVSPDTLMFGTDLPSTRAHRKYSDQDFFTIMDVLGQKESRKVFKENALNFYGV